VTTTIAAAAVAATAAQAAASSSESPSSSWAQAMHRLAWLPLQHKNAHRAKGELMSNGVLAFFALTLVSAIFAFTEVAPDVVGVARVAFFGFLTLFLFAGALTGWNGPTVRLPEAT
jgi:hypothetical protein